jgi:hypothetical protein
MALWFRKVPGLNSATMRQIATDAGVSWDFQAIVYRGGGIGYSDGDPTDATAIQDAAESLLGYRPVEIDAPPEPAQDLAE